MRRTTTTLAISFEIRQENHPNRRCAAFVRYLEFRQSKVLAKWRNDLMEMALATKSNAIHCRLVLSNFDAESGNAIEDFNCVTNSGSFSC